MSSSAQPQGGPSLLAVAYRSYLAQLKQNPLRTKALTSSVIAGLSDVIAQSIVKGGFTADHNWKKTMAMCVYGLLWNGPSAHFWQNYMERVFQGGTGLQTVLRKVLLDQTTYGPVCNLMFMSFATLVLEGRGLAQLKSKVLSDYPLVQLNGWKLWPLAALINYKFVPLQFRVLFINCVALCWSIFLLLKTRKAPPTRSQKQPAPVYRQSTAAHLMLL